MQYAHGPQQDNLYRRVVVPSMHAVTRGRTLPSAGAARVLLYCHTGASTAQKVLRAERPSE